MFQLHHDVNEDGIVDVSDLLIVVGNWGECEQDPPMNMPPDQDLM